jgi:heterotetrameric sarcosine oxidase gamma subunit
MNQEKPNPLRLKPDQAHWQDLLEEKNATALMQSGINETSYHGQSIEIRELTGTSFLRIHSLSPVEHLNEALSGSDIALPAEVNQSQGQDPAVICQAPGEWLLFSEYLESNRLLEQIHVAVESEATSVIDLTAALTVFRLEGAAIPWLLNKLCGLDIQKLQQLPAYGTRTRLQHAAVTVHYHQPGSQAVEHVYDMILDRSMAAYAWQLLTASVPHAEELHRNYG